MPSPAFVSRKTSCPARTNSAALSGVRPTRYSWTLISFGEPTRMGNSSNRALEYRKKHAQSRIFRYIPTSQRPFQSIQMPATQNSPVPLDEFDHKILIELERDGVLTAAALAEKVGLSPSACHRRVKAMEAAGVIEGYAA